MRYEDIIWASEQQTGSPSAKAVLLAIARHTDAAGNGICFPSQDVIARLSEQSIDSVQRRIVGLVERGLLRCIPLVSRGLKTNNMLILATSPHFAASLSELASLLPAWLSIRGAETSPQATATMPQVAATMPQVAATMPQSAGSIPQTVPQSAVNGTALLRQHESLESGNLTPPTPPCGGAVDFSQNAKGDERERFERCYRAFPTHKLANRRGAQAEFAKLTPEDQAWAAAAAPLFIADCKAQRHPVKGAQGWLRQRRFEQFPEVRPGPQGPPSAAIAPTDPRWAAALERLRAKLGGAVVASWFGQVALLAIEDGTVRLSAPTRFAKSRIESQFADALLAGWRSVVPDVTRVAVEVASIAPTAPPLPPQFALPLPPVVIARGDGAPKAEPPSERSEGTHRAPPQRVRTG